PLNEGCAADFMPDPAAPFGHDPHCVVQHPRAPDRLYQQNHCGIYRLDRPERRWVRIGSAMPKRIGDIGFPIVAHPAQADTAWVLPMDGQTVWPRTSIDGKPAVYRTRDGGRTWRRLDRGLPERSAWLTVLRQAMCADRRERVGLYFGTTGGDVWAGANEGERWRCIARHLPEIYSVTHAV
ncbi:MAG: glycosyl hydrolase, partial [Steroidobacteraceae bacterium]